MNASDIAKKKGIPRGSNILDYMGIMELSANLFTATQTEYKLRKENITDRKKAEEIHYAVGTKVRKMITEIKGIMPENIPIEKI